MNPFQNVGQSGLCFLGIIAKNTKHLFRPGIACPHIPSPTGCVRQPLAFSQIGFAVPQFLFRLPTSVMSRVIHQHRLGRAVGAELRYEPWVNSIEGPESVWRAEEK